MKNLFGLVITVLFCSTVFGQASVSSLSFLDVQRTLPRPSDALKRKEDTLQKQFKDKGFNWPAKYMYIRSFKYDSQLEVWIKNERNQPYRLFKTFKVCALAGTLGPKRIEGDYQVPEGFYYINEFNPRSNYHLSLGLNYPNPSDRLLSDNYRPGGDIYIHGSCVTVGCIPIKDDQIEELYILAAHSKNAGQDFIPVHIFPIRYSNKKSQEYLNQLTKTDTDLKSFAETLENVYEHFEATKQLPVVMVNGDGKYVFANLIKKQPPVASAKKVHKPRRVRNIPEVAEAVHVWPQFPGGNESFLKYLDKMGQALAVYLPTGVNKAHVQVEFIVDVDGMPANFKVINGVNEDFDNEMVSVLEQMPTWQPALLHDKPVAKKIKQSFVVQLNAD